MRVLFLLSLRLYPLFKAGEVYVLDTSSAFARGNEGIFFCRLVYPTETAEWKLLIETLTVEVVAYLHILLNILKSLHLSDLPLVIYIHLSD